jgi:hypothetical protein
MQSMTVARQELEAIPGVGPAIANMLRTVGIQSQHDLADKDPEKLYRHYEEHVGHHVDRCVLYVFRCAVYYCATPDPDPELLKWWNWKDKS